MHLHLFQDLGWKNKVVVEGFDELHVSKSIDGDLEQTLPGIDLYPRSTFKGGRARNRSGNDRQNSRQRGRSA